MKAGLVSITFRQKSPREIVELARRAGLAGIEWGGDVHAPHGDVQAARQVRASTREAGLEVACYGSYYRAGESENEGLSWAQVLASARALEAPLIRVWAGKKGSREADAKYLRAVVDDLKRVCEACEVPVALEFHGGTLTDTSQSALQVLEAVNHPRLKALWQPANDRSFAARLEDLRALQPFLANLHVFHWGDGGYNERLPLEEGAAPWRQYLPKAQSASWALLEFVRDDSVESFERDARTLRGLVGELKS
jgi:3-dehydroshikimate dehydratase